MIQTQIPIVERLQLGATATGALLMRANVANIVRVVGLRNLLVACSLITASMSYGFVYFTAETSPYLISAYAFVFGMLRNAQHQSVSALAYSDVPREDVSKSTTIAALVQRGGQSFGVAMAASLLALFAGGEVIGVEAFTPVFIVLALITASAALGFSDGSAAAVSAGSPGSCTDC